MINVFNVKVLTPAMVVLTHKINKSVQDGHFYFHGFTVEMEKPGMEEALSLLQKNGWRLKSETIPEQSGNGYDRGETPEYTRHTLIPG